jgi:hypothetical protein
MPYLIAAFVALAIAVCVWFATRQARRQRRQLRAREEFNLQREDLQKRFFEAAASSGKPRGLAWKSCDFHDGALFAVDRANGELHALVGVTISFEAIEGGGMEEVEAVGNLRCATAVFTTRDGQWTTDGRAVFNLEPHETLERFGDSLESFSTD